MKICRSYFMWLYYLIISILMIVIIGQPQLYLEVQWIGFFVSTIQITMFLLWKLWSNRKHWLHRALLYFDSTKSLKWWPCASPLISPAVSEPIHKFLCLSPLAFEDLCRIDFVVEMTLLSDSSFISHRLLRDAAPGAELFKGTSVYSRFSVFQLPAF